MPTWLPTLLKAVLAVAALVAVPVATYLQGHEALNGVLGFVAALLALFLPPPARKPPDIDL